MISVPRGRVVNTLGKASILALAFNLLCVDGEGSGLVGHLNLGTVDSSSRSGLEQPVLGVVHVRTGRRLVVLHNATRSEEIVDHVAAEGDGETNSKDSLCVSIRKSTHADALVSHINGLLERAHVFCRRQSTARGGVQSVHFYLFL